MIKSCLVAAVALGLGIGVAAPVHSTEKPSYLFVQSSDSATIEALPTIQNGYRITMTDSNPELVYFSDQPFRKAGLIPAADFVPLFDKEKVRKVEPNAALVWSTPDRGALIVKIARASYDSNTHTATYEVVTLNAAHHALADFEQRKVSGPPPPSLSKPTLFIDDFKCSPWDPRC